MLKLRRFEPDDARPEFTCGDADLDEFFAKDSILGSQELMSVTYGVLNEADELVAFVSLLNDSIKREEDVSGSALRRFFLGVPRAKRYKSTPTVKVGRLGVSTKYQGHGIGTQVLDYLKVWFTRGNKTGCRFLVLDAYNTPRAVQFYVRNGFQFLSPADEGEETRIMYFDLMTFLKAAVAANEASAGERPAAVAPRL